MPPARPASTPSTRFCSRVSTYGRWSTGPVRAPRSWPLLEATTTFLQAAEENEVTAIVNMSQLSARRDAVSNAARRHWLAERLLDHFPGSVTHLRPTFFAEWLISTFDRATGEIRSAYGISPSEHRAGS